MHQKWHEQALTFMCELVTKTCQILDTVEGIGSPAVVFGRGPNYLIAACMSRMPPSTTELSRKVRIVAREVVSHSALTTK